MNYLKQRQTMVDVQLKARGISDKRVLDAMLTVQRHRFVSEENQDRAYDDCALPIGQCQTISQPYMVALMSEMLELSGQECVLEIGTGSGYQAAVLSLLAGEIYSVERIPGLAESAAALLHELGCRNVHVINSDGTLGLDEYAPYDRIIVTAASPRVPHACIKQLNDPGRMVIPVGSRVSQELHVIIKKEAEIETVRHTLCVFVPLIGRNGWPESSEH